MFFVGKSDVHSSLSPSIRYATEVDVDFVRKSVRAIGRCAIKVEQAAERCVSTLIDLIQTKVNYVVQEAIVVIKVRTTAVTSLHDRSLLRTFSANIQINTKVSSQRSVKISTRWTNPKLGEREKQKIDGKCDERLL